MAYPELNKRCTFAAKVETTFGTVNAPSLSTDAIRLIGASEPQVLFLAPNSRADHITGGLGAEPDAPPSGMYGRAHIRLAARGAGAAYAYSSEASKTVPECHVLLRGAGLALTVSGGAGSEVATYNWSDAPATSFSAILEVSGKKWLFVGAVFENVTVTVDAGGFPIIEGDVVGVLSRTEQALEAATYSTVALGLWKGSNSLVVSSYNPQVQRLEIAFNNTAQPNVDANVADALVGFLIVARRPLITFQARVPAISTWDPLAAQVAKTVTTLDAIMGNTQYKRLKLNVDNGSYEDVQETRDGEFRNYNVVLLAGAHATAECPLIWD